MIRSASCRKAMSVIALVLMGLMVASLADADDEYASLTSQSNLFVGRGSASVATEDDDFDHHDICFCPVCLDSFEMTLPVHIALPEAEAWFAALSPTPISSLYHPEILRPPIS